MLVLLQRISTFKKEHIAVPIKLFKQLFKNDIEDKTGVPQSFWGVRGQCVLLVCVRLRSWSVAAPPPPRPPPLRPPRPRPPLRSG